MKSNAERQKAYRERKKAAKAAEVDLQAPVDPAPESAMQTPEPELLERYRKELQPEPVLEEPLTYFDVYKRRHEDMFR
jgi:hypothetical protein